MVDFDLFDLMKEGSRDVERRQREKKKHNFKEIVKVRFD